MSQEGIEEKRDPQLLGRRKGDHSDGQIEWLDEHFRAVIKSEIGGLKSDLVSLMEALLDRALGGDIPARVAALEQYHLYRELRTVVTSVVASTVASLCVLFGGRLMGWWL
jgi:hypothetical protein